MVLMLKKWGNSQGLIIPKEVLKQANINSQNPKFDVRVTHNNEIVLKENKTDLKSLFKDFDYKKYWSEYEDQHKTQSKELDWGKPIGREVF